jgi:hypothetical protein
MSRHIVEFRKVMTVYEALNMPHDNNAKFAMFRETFIKGNCTDYETIFNYYENVGVTVPWTIETIFTRVIDKYQELSSRRYEKKNSPQGNFLAHAQTIHTVNALTTSTSTKTCTLCGKGGHDAKNCWANITCGKCHRKGHPTEKCRSGGDSRTSTVRRANAVRIEDNKPQETLVSSFKKNRNK